MMTPAEAHKTAVTALEAAQHHLGGIPRTDPAARAAALQAVEEAAARVRAGKEAVKAELMSRSFACVSENSPLFLACREQLDGDTVERLEQRALEIQRERNEAAAARRAAKAAAAPTAAPSAGPPAGSPTPVPSSRRGIGAAPTAKSMPEIIHRRPNGGPP